MRNRRLDWHDHLFFILLGVSVLAYSLSRFLQVRFFAVPAMVIMAPRSLAGGMFTTLDQLKLENRRLGELCVRQLLDNGYWRDRARSAAQDSLAARCDLRRVSVVARDPQSLLRTLVVDQGILSGVRADMAAITEAGVAGKVTETGANLSFVATVLNPRVKIAALDLRSRVAGVTSYRDGGLLAMDYVLADNDVAVGDTIVTSGTGGIFPKGLPVGTVVRVDSAPRGMFRSIAVRPFVNVSALEDVYLIEPKDWAGIERQRKLALEELRISNRKDLVRLLEESRVEVREGEPARQE
jgi:rod shape-determining protein MreC